MAVQVEWQLKSDEHVDTRVDGFDAKGIIQQVNSNDFSNFCSFIFMISCVYVCYIDY